MHGLRARLCKKMLDGSVRYRVSRLLRPYLKLDIHGRIDCFYNLSDVGNGFGLDEFCTKFGGESFAVDRVVSAKDMKIFATLPDAVKELGVSPEHF